MSDTLVHQRKPSEPNKEHRKYIIIIKAQYLYNIKCQEAINNGPIIRGTYQSKTAAATMSEL